MFWFTEQNVISSLMRFPHLPLKTLILLQQRTSCRASNSRQQYWNLKNIQQFIKKLQIEFKRSTSVNVERWCCNLVLILWFGFYWNQR